MHITYSIHSYIYIYHLHILLYTIYVYMFCSVSSMGIKGDPCQKGFPLQHSPLFASGRADPQTSGAW